jgi:penicillin-binding protein 1A
VLYASADAAVQAVKPETAFLMTSMLQDVIDGGTAWKARQLGFRLPAAGKTGTTNEYRDAWFVGYTRSLVTGVWVGYDTPKPILPGAAYAADVAVPLWAQFMKVAKDAPEPFAPPRGVVAAQICRLSGKRPSAGCDAVPVTLEDGGHEERSMVTTEYFVAGTEPEESCPLHVGRSLFGRFANWLAAPKPQESTGTAGAADAAAVEAPAAAPVSPLQQTPEAAATPEPDKKRGFWGRLFGRRDRGDADKKDQKKPPPRPR